MKACPIHTVTHTHTHAHTHTHTHISSQVRLHPITHTSHCPISQIHHSEKAISGYPILSPTSTTLVQSVVSILYQLQSREPWSRAITQVNQEFDSIIHAIDKECFLYLYYHIWPEILPGIKIWQFGSK